MIEWNKNFQRDIPLDKWEASWKNIRLLKAMSYKENCYKMLCRWHLSPAKLARIYKTDETCWKCGQAKGTFFHQWWTCKLAKAFWSMIFKILNKALNGDIDPSPELALTSIFPDELHKTHKYILLLLLTAARLLYATKWKSSSIPSENEYINKILEVIELDRLSNRLSNDGVEEFIDVWVEVYRNLGFKFNPYDLSD